MTALPRAFALSLGQLGDPAIIRVLAKSLLVTCAIFAALGLLAWRGMEALAGSLGTDWARQGELAGIVLAILGGWLLFRFVALAVIQVFADDIVRAVERRHYPQAAAVGDPPLRIALRSSVRGLLRAVAVNALALPAALVLVVTGVGPALLLWAVNAWLLGRELTEMVWLRHRPGDSRTALPVGPATRLALGGVVAALLAVPFLNLIAPVLGAATAAHLVHGRNAKRAPSHG